MGTTLANSLRCDRHKQTMESLVCNFQSMKTPVELNSFVISPGLLYHLIRRDYGRLANEAFTSNPVVSLKQ